MQTYYNSIGEVAGKIYHALSKGESKAATTLQKEIGSTDETIFYQAIGWLAREGKLNFDKKGKTLKVSLVSSEVSCCRK